MTTGKTIKAEVERRYSEGTLTLDDGAAILVEHERLEREVIQAAKADLEAETRKDGDIGIDRLIAARRAYRAAVNALLAFEANQKK